MIGRHMRMNTDSKIYEIACDIYLSMKEMENIENIESFDKYVAANLDAFQDDGNLGLVNQCRYSIVYYYLKKLKKVYSRMLIPDFYNHIHVDPKQLNINILV